LAGLNVYEGLGIDDPEEAKWRDYVFRARGRDLRGAIFDFTSLPKADFSDGNYKALRLSLRSFHMRSSTARSFRARR
jgi:hypothetical protein